MSVIRCQCPSPHVDPVELSEIHILGPGKAWRAAKPGGMYIAGHGFHFENEADANTYAFGDHGTQEELDLGLTI